MGHVGGQHCEVVYDDVRVPYSNLLGERGQGIKIAISDVTSVLRDSLEFGRAVELCDFE
jgi:alkylation response protein AidB-like acyl-CoA dehydrogenase